MITCMDCNTALSSPSELATHHQRVHASPRPVSQCLHSESAFPGLQSLNVYTAATHGEKPQPQSSAVGRWYPCDVCGHHFASNTDLKEHMRSVHEAANDRTAYCGNTTEDHTLPQLNYYPVLNHEILLHPMWTPLLSRGGATSN